MLKNHYPQKKMYPRAIALFLSLCMATTCAVPVYAEWKENELSVPAYETKNSFESGDTVNGVNSTVYEANNGGIALQEEYTLPTLPADRPLRLYYESLAIAPASDEDSTSISTYSTSDNNYLYFIYNTLTDSEKAEMNAAVREITSGIPASWSDLDKVLYVHDILVSTRCYDLTYTKYDAYNNLVEKTSVCQGYAEAIWYILYTLGIDCKIVSSDELNHAWNLVKLNGKWYHLDATWDDPVSDTPGNSRHTYFLMSDNAIMSVGDGKHGASDFHLSYESGKSAYGYAVDPTYDEWFWAECKAPICFDGNYYYYPNSDGIYKIDKNNNKSLLVDLSSTRWYVIGESGYYWKGAFSGIGLNGNTLYYNDATHVYSCDLNGNNRQVIYELPAADAASVNIYMLNYRNGMVAITLTSSPNDEIKTQRNIPVSASVVLPAIKVTAGDRQATVSWTGVLGATKYRVFTYLNGKYTQIGETASTSYTVTNLTNGTKYGFLVLAYNGSNWSKYTVNDVVYATPVGFGLPAFTVTAGKNQATVKWNALSGAKKYRIFTYLNGKYTQIGETTSTSYVVKGLSGGIKYGFLVLAYNGSVWSPYNTALDVVYATPSGIAKPTFTVTAGKNQATVKWSAVSGAKKYRLFTYLNGKYTQVGETTSMSYVVKGLSGGVKYGFLVLANDGSSWSPYSTALDVVYATPTGLTKPVFTVTAGKNQATVKWSAVKGATSYRVFTYLNGKFTKAADTTSTSIVVKALSGGVKHGFLVVANDGSGWTPYNTALDVVYATPTGIAKPTFTVTAGKNQATIKWSAVKSATSYRVFTYLNGKFTKVADTTSTSIVVKALSGGVKHGFLVVANDGSGWTPYNTALDVVYATPTGIAKPTFTVTAGKNQATVKWSAVKGATSYRVFTYLNGKFTKVADTTSTSIVVKALSGGVKYGFLVLANDGSGWTLYNTALDVVYATPSK